MVRLYKFTGGDNERNIENLSLWVLCKYAASNHNLKVMVKIR